MKFMRPARLCELQTGCKVQSGGTALLVVPLEMRPCCLCVDDRLSAVNILLGQYPAVQSKQSVTIWIDCSSAEQDGGLS